MTEDRAGRIEAQELGSGDLVASIRARIRTAIELVLEDELAAALGATRHQQTGERQGYRNGHLERDLVTEAGPARLSVPRGRLKAEDGTTTEWRSAILPRYQRRTKRVDEALLGTYLSGTNQRRIRRALSPLLGEANLSRSAVSRLVGKLQAHFDAWRTRDLSQEAVVFLFLDAILLAVRVGKRVVKVPIQAALGVQADGRKVLLSLRAAGSESTESWKSTVRDLAQRGLATPLLVVIDGNAGLSRAVGECWPAAKIQRCTRHKLENLLAHAPKHCHREIVRDFRAVTHAESAAAARAAYDVFLTKWRKTCSAVAQSLQQAGEHLLSFTLFPKSPWKCLRTTNQLERLNGEFRRRTKTQGSFRHEDSALVLLWGLIAFGQIRLRKVDGWTDIAAAIASLNKAA